MIETLAELPFIGDQVVCLSHEPGRGLLKIALQLLREKNGHSP
jgi:hypothetical protein